MYAFLIAGGILMDRKDALTKRPLDFDREEETRKGETIKWLESHFGSESTASNDSREDEVDVIEPTKKTYFNVTIKSSQNQLSAPVNPSHEPTDKKGFVKRGAEVMNGGSGVATNNGAKYYQGISNWNNRKQVTPTTPANHFASKAFRDDLHASIERSQLRKSSAVYTSKDNLNVDKPPYIKSNPIDNYVSQEDILQQKRQSLSSQFLARSRQNSRDHLDDVERVVPPAFDDDRYISGSRTDLHYGLNLKEKEKRGYTRAEVMDEPDSPLPPRKNSYVEERAKSYERSFVENNRYNSLRSDKTPPHREMSTLERPVVPQRRRNGEKKLRQQHDASSDLKSSIEVAVPPPDYSPPPRSRSSSPREDYHNVRAKSYPQQLYSNSSVAEQLPPRDANTLIRKQNQRTRFARNTPSPPPTTVIHQHPHQMHHNQTLRPSMLTQTTQTQTTPSTISTSTVASHRSSKVGQAIGNSLRKLVGKLRSASVERKLRMKSKSKSRDHSPAPPAVPQNQRNITTYQQYNVIDGHIGGNHQNTTSHDDSEDELSSHQRIQYQASKTGDSVYSNASIDRRALLHSSSSHPVGANNRDGYRVISPKQRYYLGEDPYSSTLYGKENVQENVKLQRNGGNITHYNNRENSSSSTHTLGRYQKGNHRISGSTPNLNQGYRTTQTLPRKLNEQPTIHQYETQTMNISRSNVTGKVQSKLRQQQQLQQQQQQSEQRIAYQPIAQNTGPLKPARTYAKSLNRSKSFSVHAMNGSNDPSPIYLEKLNSNNYSNNLQSSHAFKSNPHLYSSSKENTAQQTPLKSPSIVNLISRSQRDLSKIGTNEDESDNYADRQAYINNRKYYDERKPTPPYRAGPHIEDEYKYRSPGHYHLQQKHSLDSRGSVDINKDTASIVRHEEYQRTKRTPPSGSTIIKVRNMDYRK